MPTVTSAQRICVAVPEGSVMMYSPNVMHRGRGNEYDKDRLIVTLTLMGANGLVPNGIPLACLPQDEGRWYIEDSRLHRAEETRY